MKTRLRRQIASVNQLEIIWCFAVSPDSEFLALGETVDVGPGRSQSVGAVKVVTLPSGKEIADVAIPNPQTGKGVFAVRSVSFSPNGNLMAVASDAFPFNESLLTIIDTNKWLVRGQSSASKGIIRSQCFSRDNMRILAASDDQSISQGEVFCFKVKELKSETILTQRKGTFACITCSPVADLFVCGGDNVRKGSASDDGADGILVVGDWHPGKPIGKLVGHHGTVLSVALSSRGDLIAAGDGSGRLTVWKTSTRDVLLTVKAHTSLIISISFSPQEDIIATGGNDGRIELWELGRSQK
jgi:WD40 repeat protein